jgi:hypothetical protein
VRFLRRLFLFIFFSGMLYTVFNYVPIIEEEVSAKKLTQSSQTDSSDGGNENDSENGSDDLFHVKGASLFFNCGVDVSFARYLQSFYIPPLSELNTPPPKQVA